MLCYVNINFTLLLLLFSPGERTLLIGLVKSWPSNYHDSFNSFCQLEEQTFKFATL